MKKILLAIVILISIGIFTTNAQSTIPISFTAHGGYSWSMGVVGAEAQFGHIGLAAGWLPCKMPLSGTRIHSYSGAISYYTRPAGEFGDSYYVSIAEASQGYRYEDSWGGETISPMTIITAGMKYDAGGVWTRAGVGYGWCSLAGTFTFEINIGFTLFGN